VSTFRTLDSANVAGKEFMDLDPEGGRHFNPSQTLLLRVQQLADDVIG